jgi:predicted anti-sigma-YlaC factor YlaD
MTIQNSADIPIDGFDPRPINGPVCHPTERALQRYVSNETGPQRKKKIAKHLEECTECRTLIGRFRDFYRRLREFERVAISRATLHPS